VSALRVSNRIFLVILAYAGLQACSPSTSVQEKVTNNTLTTTTDTSQRFADGVKAVKIITSVTAAGSFVNPGSLPASTPIPSPYPGYDGITTYLPGVKATQYFAVDGTTVIAKPSWLVDVQVGITGTSSSSTCAAFGGSGTYDAQNFYRVSEPDCGGGSPVANGLGGGTDPVFVRVVLDRNQTYIGSAENLMMQVEYQASGLHLNSDGVSATPEDNLDQLWKIFWNSTLGTSSIPKPFSIFVPPNYAACLDSGSGAAGAPGNCIGTYKGSPIKVKQVIIPLSAYPSMNVIQLTRVKGRITQPGNYVGSFCSSDSPLCLGVVIRSITLMRM
jgi:hypothetical protein